MGSGVTFYEGNTDILCHINDLGDIARQHSYQEFARSWSFFIAPSCVRVSISLPAHSFSPFPSLLPAKSSEPLCQVEVVGFTASSQTKSLVDHNTSDFFVVNQT